MSDNLTTLHRSGRLVCVTSDIDESFEGTHIPGERGVIVFNLRGARRVTSFGVREWIAGLKSLDAEYYCFTHCHPSIISQFNMISGFGHRGEIISFYAPYICQRCDQDVEHLIDLRRDYESLASGVAPAVACPGCGHPAEFNDLPEVFFEHVSRSPAPRPPASANAIIDGRASEERAAFNIRKGIDDTVTALWPSGHLDKAGYLKRLEDGLQGHVVMIAADVTEISDDGAAGMIRFLSGSSVEVFLARVPLAIAEPLTRILASAPTTAAEVVSVRVPFSCVTCGERVGLDLDVNELQRAAHNAYEAACPRCMGRLVTAWSTDQKSLVFGLPLAKAPPSILGYLRSHVEYLSETCTDSPSDLVFGKYRVLERLGSGGMGEVYLARHVGPGAFEKLVVLKRIRRANVGKSDARSAFLHEARVAARLSHPNIVQAFDFDEVGGEYIIAMEYVDGIDLAKALNRARKLERPWPVDICCRIVGDLCSALHAAHQYADESGRVVPIVHRDVSPSNVLISTHGVIKLTDFGIAKAADSGDQTMPGIFKGKQGYAAPEQILPKTNSSPMDHRVDIFAAGTVLFECLTLNRLVPHGADLSVARAVLESPAPRLSQFRDDVPDQLQAVLDRAMCPDPASRYPTARDFLRGLEEVLKTGGYSLPVDLLLWAPTVLPPRTSTVAAATLESHDGETGTTKVMPLSRRGVVLK